ncbi:MAG: DUF2065 domain-containing protein [Deltaproteobacteria bacterium]|nr:DUF2065 domain-containing protein [Candidatus Anaeroferrophillacea bacterium]
MKLFLLALGLALILEGMPYFLFPRRLRELLATLSGQPETTLRFFGLTAMCCGLLLLVAGRYLPR